jgi:hypothetical protein
MNEQTHYFLDNFIRRLSLLNIECQDGALGRKSLVSLYILAKHKKKNIRAPKRIKGARVVVVVMHECIWPGAQQ